MSDLLRFQLHGEGCTLIVKFADNGARLGEMMYNDDGYYVWFPERNGGYWDAPILRAIADTLDKLNAPWDARVKAFLDNQPATQVETGDNHAVGQV